MKDIILTTEEQKYLFSNQHNIRNFRNKIKLGNKDIHCKLFSSILCPQIYRIYSLLAKNLGIDTVIYNYVEKNNNYILYCESMIKENEKLYEEELYSSNSINIFFNWLEIIESLNDYQIKQSFYKQIFFSLLINDIDKEIAIIKNNQNYRLAPYYDYGGVYWNQNELELQKEFYYLPVRLSFYEFLDIENEEELKNSINEEFKSLINKEIINGPNPIINIENYETKLKLCLENLDSNFIEQCLNIDILKIIDMDTKHNYPNNVKVVIKTMFEHSKNILYEQINSLKKDRVKKT